MFGWANGAWLEATEIPEDRATYGAFHLLSEQAEHDVRAICEQAASGRAAAGSVERLVGDLWTSFMDTEQIEALGIGPIGDELAVVETVHDADSLMRVVGRLQRHGGGGLVAPYVNTDARNADRYLVYLEQSGLGLPDESYYREDAFADLRAAYQQHITKMLRLGGEATRFLGDPQQAAADVLALETQIAGRHWDRVDCRDAVRTYNLRDADAMRDEAPIPWDAWIDGLGATEAHLDEVVVRQPSFLAGAAGLIADAPLRHWRAWLAWNTLHADAAYLSERFVEENFDFYGRTLSGTPQLRERWKRAVSFLEAAAGEAVGQLYVAQHFPPEAKERMLGLVDNLVRAYRHDIEALDWMSGPTRERALEKLEQFRAKIGYPDRWRDYRALEVRASGLLDNARAAAAFETDRELAKLGGPVDRDEWFMTPMTVNAYYNPGMNEIVFPAAILQPPFFDVAADDAENYGGIGAVIGHEIGHGFDDQGSRYDGRGELLDWWTEEDRGRFEERSKSLIAQYDAFEPRQLPGLRVNGALTVGENIGDLGGVTVAYQAYQLALDGHQAPVIDELTGPQRFFRAFATIWRGKARSEEAKRRLQTDPHAPEEFRANVVRNVDAFYTAFDVRQGDGLYLEPQERVTIW